MSKRFLSAAVLAVTLLGAGSTRGELMDLWRAADLEVLDDGDTVGSWTSRSNRLATAPIGKEPHFKKNATPTGESSVQFNLNRLTVGSSPVAGMNAFTLALVFKVSQAGVDEGSGWSTKSGIVDANEAGVANDWGLSVRENGFIAFGTGTAGGSDQTVYLDNQPTYSSVVDSNYHVLVCTWSGGTMTMYLDNKPPKSGAGSTLPRNNAGLSFGGIHTAEASRQFVGDLCEIQFHRGALTSTEASNLVAQLTGQYISRPRPEIISFRASTNFLYLGSGASLSWAVSGADALWIDNGIGSISATGNVQILPAVSSIYTLSASNRAGIRTAQAAVTVDPGVPAGIPQTVTAIKNTPKVITLAGSDPQNAPLSFAIVQPPAHGQVLGSFPEVTYIPANGYTGPDLFTFKVNDGTFDSPPANVELYVDDVAQPPHGLFLSCAEVNPAVTPGTFLGALRAADVNRLDTHTFALVPGVGATNNSMFTVSGDRLLAGAGFPTLNGVDLWIRLRATDSAGLALEKVFRLETETPSRAVVINEIHYNPPENTIREEFIELYNPGSTTVSLSLWRLRGGVDYIFPAGTSLASGAYLVVAGHPATLQSRYSVNALGPWSGNLSSDGEQITLRDSADEIVDEVDYKTEFPWPIWPNGNGPSMELINPSLDNNLGSSWACPLSPAVPSPGKTNRVYALNVAPNIRQVNHTPKQPHSTNQVTVTAKVTDPQGVKSVTLSFQVVAPGNFIPSYIPLSVSQLKTNAAAQPPANPAFEAATNWVTVTMHDDGINGDADAGDDIYSILLPVQPNRSLVRYRITITDTFGTTRRAPFADDPSLNFAYFIYDGIPDYGVTTAEALQQLPVYFFLTRNVDFEACTAYKTADQIPQLNYNDARYIFNWPGAFVYEGEVYDHVRYRLRGANGRYMAGKRNFRFRFNEGRFFAAKDEFGTPYPRKWASLSTAKGESNRGTLTFSLNEYLNYLFLNTVGVPAPWSHYFHWRVVRSPLEAPDLFSGDFFGVTWVQEEYDAAFLEAHNLPKGNLYKLINVVRDPNPNRDMVEQQRYQGTFAATNGNDAIRIQNALLNPTSSQTDEWLLANVNYTNWYIYHTVVEAVRNYDTWPSANKNAAWFFDTEYTAANQYNGRFWTLPWDWTDTWGPTWNAGQDLAWNGIWGPTASLHPDMQRDYRNTMREIRDLFFQPDQINPLIDAVAARLAPIAAADLLRWSNCPPVGSSYSSMLMPGPALSQGLPGYVRDLKNFMFIGGSYGWWADRSSVPTGGWISRLDTLANDGAIPFRPAMYYVGQAGYPMNSLTFESGPFMDSQGGATFAGMQWRLAEVLDTNQAPADPRVLPPLEWNALWDSGLLTTWNNRMTIPGVYTQTNKLYRARVRHLDDSGRWSRWSLPVEFRVSPVDVMAQLREGLRFSEIMYNPPAMGIYGGDDLEFLELKNISTNTLDMAGLWFSGITFAFTNGTVIGPGQIFLLGRNPDALSTKYPGLNVQGIYSGKLDNAGETISLLTPLGQPVLEVTYGDAPPWPVTADGLGWSLVLSDPAKGTYRPSSSAGGSPGIDDVPATIPPILITEVLAHTDPPLTDSVELFNPTAASVNLKGWFLSDDASLPFKFRIGKDFIIPSGGYQVLNEADFNPNNAGLAFSSLGDETYLFSGTATGTNLTGYVHGATYGASENSVSFGRHVNSVGVEDFVAVEAITLSTNNAQPRVGPVVISEIMFQPPANGTNEQYELEFVELQNITATNVPLYDPAFPTNTWRLRNAVDFDFPPGVSLPAQARLLVVPFDPANATALANFHNAYGPGSEVALYGPWSGRLNNSGESVELKYPDEPEIDGLVPYIQVEKVSYAPGSPWPTGASGSGGSIHRAGFFEFGNEPLNWRAGAPTPGGLYPDGNQDADGDGVPDFWELLYQTNPRFADSTLDPDGDLFTNLQEWHAGTNPQDPASFLRLQAVPSGASVLLQFTAAADRSYSILTAPVPEAAIWFGVTNVAPAATNRSIAVPQPADAAAFYRLVTPAQE